MEDRYRNDFDRPDDLNYWKLVGVFHEDEIDDEAFEFDEEETLDYARKQRGLLDYDECTDEEVEGFCKARCLPWHEKPEVNVGTLRAADDEIVFERFVDLPPELRVRIYEWYQAWLRNGFAGEYSRPPPFASVSKLVRQEALSVFFRDRMFFMSGTGVLGTNLEVVETTHTFFMRAPKAFLRCVKRLTIMCPIPIVTTTWRAVLGFAEWEIDLGEKRARFVSMGTTMRKGFQEEIERKAEATEERLRDFVDDVVERKAVCLRRKDVDAVLDSVVKGTRSSGLVSNMDP